MYQASDQQQSNAWHISVIQIACCGQHLCTECVKGTKLFDTQTRTHDNTKQVWCNVSEAWISIDTEAGMLSGISRKRSIRSNPYWFTEFCNSQCLSHFAAPFIVVRAETSVAESCNNEDIGKPMWSIKFNTRLIRRPDKAQGLQPQPHPCALALEAPEEASQGIVHECLVGYVRMILPQVHLRKPCYDFSFL